MRRTTAFLVALLLVFGVLSSARPSLAQAPEVGLFRVVFDAELHPAPFSGRVYVALSPWAQPALYTRAFNWYHPLQVFAIDATDIPPGGSVLIGPGSLAYPAPFEQAEEGSFFAQAFVRINADSPEPGQGVGDLHSEPVRVIFRRSAPGQGELILRHSVAPRPFPSGPRLREFILPSRLLSDFHKREVKLRAGVILPKSWGTAESRTYPVLYFVTGFGSDHSFARQLAGMASQNKDADEIVIVVPDASCYHGHSVFADSATNGPWGSALTTELLPAIEREFRGNGRRYVSGISSGGWSALWLQITYPDLFHGCWSHCPDPVDFRDFQQINLYAPGANMYRDEHGHPRPLARAGGRPIIFYQDFVRMETVMGPGGQIGSFEAVFSPRADGALPRPLFDRATGAVDPETAKAWENYDINLLLSRRWSDVGPTLKGKLHIVAGEQDNFYLDGAVRKLKDTLTQLGSDASVEVIPGMMHSIHGPTMEAMFRRISRENSSGNNK
jgi:S-formylglutathione hydrolase FrmB